MAARKKQPPKEENSLWIEIVLSITILISVLMYLGYVDACGAVGRFLCNTFGLFGFLGYLFPLLLFVAVSYGVVNRKNKHAMRRLYCSIGLFLCCVHYFRCSGMVQARAQRCPPFLRRVLRAEMVVDCLED